METNQYITDFYNHYDEDARLSLRHGSVEFLTTMRYIQTYIKPGFRILEIGAGTGRYSHALARQGYTVDAVELVGHNIEIFRRNTQPGENITITQGNAMDLSAFPDNQYHITLLLGPLYHLYNTQDKRQTLSEAIRVTQKGGLIFAAYVISDGCLMDEGFKRQTINVAQYIEEGLIDSRTFAARSRPKDLFELVRKEDIDRIMATFPTTRLHYIASDGCAHGRPGIRPIHEIPFRHLRTRRPPGRDKPCPGHFPKIKHPAPFPGRNPHPPTLIHEICIKTADKPPKR